MKLFKQSAFWFVRVAAYVSLILTLFVTPVLALGPLQAEPPGTVLEVILSVLVQFAQLAGFAAAIAAVVNILKTFHVVTDSTSGKWFAGLNLVAITLLVYLKLFQPQIAVEVVDAQAATLAQILLIVLGYVVQLGFGTFTHKLLANLKLPLIGKSFSRERAAVSGSRFG